MKKIYLILGFVILILAGVIIFTNFQQKTDVINKPKETKISSIISEGGQLIDVRTPEEYKSSHAYRAINIPVDEILKGNYSRIDKNKPIYLYCRSGNRASQAKKFLESKGYENIINLGGLAQLTQDGGKVCSSVSPAC